MALYLWLISQNVNNDYDTYDSAVVVAETEEQARTIHPCGKDRGWNDPYGTWCKKPEQVKVERIGTYDPLLKPEDDSKVICASFNAG